MAVDQWYYVKNSQQIGPVDQANLKSLMRSGTVAPTDLVWKEGMADWVPASSVIVVAPSAPPSSPRPPSPPQRTTTTHSSNVEPVLSQEPSDKNAPSFIDKAKQFWERYSSQQKLAVAGGLAGAFVLAIAMIWFFGSGASIKAHLEYAPDNAIAVVYCDISSMRDSEFFKKLKEEFDDEFDKALDKMKDTSGLTPESIQSVSVWIDSDSSDSGPVLVVLKFADEIPKRFKDMAEEVTDDDEKVGDVKMYTPKSKYRPSYAFPDSYTAVVGNTKLVEEVLKRGGASPKFSESMQTAMNLADFNHAITFAGNLEEADDLKDAMQDEVPGSKAFVRKIGSFVVYGDVTHAIKLSTKIQKGESTESLAEFTLSVDAVEMIDIVKSITHTLGRAF